jgi:hypothetical protein
MARRACPRLYVRKALCVGIASLSRSYSRSRSGRHPEVAAKRPLKDDRLGCAPFEARFARTSG